MLWESLIAQVNVGLENDDWDSMIGELADIDHTLLCGGNRWFPITQDEFCYDPLALSAVVCDIAMTSV